MLGQRRRRWPNIKPPLVQRLVFDVWLLALGYPLPGCPVSTWSNDGQLTSVNNKWSTLAVPWQTCRQIHRDRRHHQHNNRWTLHGSGISPCSSQSIYWFLEEDTRLLCVVIWRWIFLGIIKYPQYFPPVSLSGVLWYKSGRVCYRDHKHTVNNGVLAVQSGNSYCYIFIIRQTRQAFWNILPPDFLFVFHVRSDHLWVSSFLLLTMCHVMYSL